MTHIIGPILSRALLRTFFGVLAVSLFGISAVGTDGISTELEEIQVTATRAGQSNLQETPIAITAIQSSLIERAGMTDLRDLAPAVPGLVVGENTGSAQLYIRGVGSNNVFAGSEPSVALYRDGLYIARPQGMFDGFLDVERIEVLRGPQGDIYGRNATGGAVNIITRKPDMEKVSAALKAGYGNYNQHGVEGYVNGPLVSEKIAGSINLQYSARDGYRENVIASGVDVDSKDSFSGRVQLMLQPSDVLSILIRTDHTRDRSVPYGYQTFLEPVFAPVANSLLGDYSRVALNFAANGRRDTWGISLEADYDMGGGWILTSLTGYRSNDFRLELDTDGTEVDVIRSFIEETQDQFSEELTLRGDIGRLHILAGAYLFSEDIDMAGTELRIVGAGFGRKPVPVAETTATAVYTNLKYDLTDKFTAEVGLRYSHEKKEYTKHDSLFSIETGAQTVDLSFEQQTRSDNVTTPKFGLQYSVSDEVFLYAKATRGFKSGGFNFTAAERGSFRPEILWAYEVGAKLSLADNRLQLNSAAFRYDYDDLQVQAFIVPGTADITNAASAKVSGLEMELRAALSEQFEFSGYIAYLDAEYAAYPEAPISGGATIDATGNALNSAPRWSGNVAITYSREVGDGTLFVRTDVGWQTRIYFTVDNNDVETQGDYALVNVSAAYEWQDGKYGVSLWGRNIFDQQYINGSAAFPPSRAGRAGAPATFGIQLSTHF